MRQLHLNLTNCLLIYWINLKCVSPAFCPFCVSSLRNSRHVWRLIRDPAARFWLLSVSVACSLFSFLMSCGDESSVSLFCFLLHREESYEFKPGLLVSHFFHRLTILLFCPFLFPVFVGGCCAAVALIVHGSCLVVFVAELRVGAKFIFLCMLQDCLATLESLSSRKTICVQLPFAFSGFSLCSWSFVKVSSETVLSVLKGKFELLLLGICSFYDGLYFYSNTWLYCTFYSACSD